MIDLSAVREARGRIQPYVHRTPLVSSATLSKRAGRPVHLKLECFQKTGSFKPRGALNNILTMAPGERDAGVITISAGNHAQGVAYAASRLGIDAVVVMPASASAAKAEAARNYGAEVILHGDVHEAFVKLEEVRKERGLSFVHPFDHDATIAGQGTLGLEIAEDLREAETILVGIGGGGLISGVALALKESLPGVRILGVEPEGAPAMSLSRKKGSTVRLDRIETIADGLAPPFVGERNFEIVQRYVDDIVLVTDDEIREAMRVLLERCKILSEPAGAAATAALLAGKVPSRMGGTTAIIVSGGNVSLDVLASCLARSRGGGR